MQEARIRQSLLNCMRNTGSEEIRIRANGIRIRARHSCGADFNRDQRLSNFVIPSAARATATAESRNLLSGYAATPPAWRTNGKATPSEPPLSPVEGRAVSPAFWVRL